MSVVVWCDKPELKITSDIAPETIVLKPLPSDSKEVRKAKKKKPYLNIERVLFDINYLGKQFCIVIQRGYRWNGANIPRVFWWLIGSMGESDFLDASMVHDKLTEEKHLVDYDRQLSSMIFRELLIASGVPKAKADTMYKAVDLYQKVCCDWRENVQ